MSEGGVFGMDAISSELEAERYFDSRSETVQSVDQQFSLNINMTSVDDFVKFVGSNFASFLFSLLIAKIWVVYITFYSSRVTGLVFTKVANRFIKDGYIRFGIY